MVKIPQKAYTFECKQEAVRRVESGQRVSEAALGVRATGYHQHRLRRARIAERRHLTDEALLVHIRAVHAETRGAYGWPRIWRESLASEACAWASSVCRD